MWKLSKRGHNQIIQHTRKNKVMGYDICKFDIDTYCGMGLDYCRVNGCHNKNNGEGKPYKFDGNNWREDEGLRTEPPAKHTGRDKKPLPPLVLGSYKRHKK
jgi:hypothetical protein